MSKARKLIPQAQAYSRFGYILIVAAVALLVIGGVSFLSGRGSLDSIKSKPVGDGQHGTARWAAPAEIAKTFHRVPFHPAQWRHPAGAGIFQVGIQEEGRLAHARRANHEAVDVVTVHQGSAGGGTAFRHNGVVARPECTIGATPMHEIGCPASSLSRHRRTFLMLGYRSSIPSRGWEEVPHRAA